VFLDGKLSSELAGAIDETVVARAIIEFEPRQTTRFFEKFNALKLPTFLNLNFDRFGFRFISTALMRKHLDKLTGMESVRGLHLDRVTKQESVWGFPIANTVRDAIPRRGYDPAPGEITTYKSGLAIGVDRARADGLTGKGVKAAILDTGLAQNRQTVIKTSLTRSVLTNYGGNYDVSGHGTHVNTIFNGRNLALSKTESLEGVAPGASSVMVRCLFTPLGVGLNSFTLKALQMAMEMDLDIVSLSLGTSAATPAEDPMYKVVQAMTNDGKLVFTSVGNSQHTMPNQVNGPADINGIISVGAWSLTDNAPAYFSSRGTTADGRTCPHFYAPGGGRVTKDLKPMEGILSSTTGYLDIVSGGLKLAALPGSSQACPHMAGLAALWQEYVKRTTNTKLTASDLLNISFKFGGSTKLVQYDWIKEVVG